MARPSRQELGQWFTPESVADLALSLALHQAPLDASILDPSCGDGVFLKIAHGRGFAAERLLGVDIDSKAIGEARAELPDANLQCGNFFEARTMDLPQVDVIVGNPPYVRQERLEPEVKRAIVDSVSQAWPQLGRDRIETLVGRSDLAAPFVLRLLGQLRPGGVAALVLSSAFFDSGYGVEFWKLAEQVASLRMVVDAPSERWFSEAAVHAVIAIFDAEPSDAPVNMVRLTESTSASAALLRRGGSLDDVSEGRLAPRGKPHAWAAALRAPKAWLQFAEAAREFLVPLGELATIRRGVTSGANEIFYLNREQLAAWDIEASFLKPLLTARGRGGLGAVQVDAEELEQFALVVDRDIELAEHPALQGYLESFSGAPERSSLRNRNPWWALQPHSGQVFLCKAYGERFVQPYSAFPMVADQRMYCLQPKGGLNPELLAALLNSAPTFLALEALGRASMGQGALEWTVGDAAKLPVLDIRGHRDPASVLAAFSKLSQRPIGKLAVESDMPDRVAFDDAVLAGWPTLVKYRAGLWQALVTTCEARHARAKSGLQ